MIQLRTRPWSSCGHARTVPTAPSGRSRRRSGSRRWVCACSIGASHVDMGEFNMRSSAITGALLAQLFLPAFAYGQTLGDVARKEEVRRKTVAAPAKVYTNDNLRPSDQPAATAAAPSP